MLAKLTLKPAAMTALKSLVTVMGQPSSDQHSGLPRPKGRIRHADKMYLPLL